MEAAQVTVPLELPAEVEQALRARAAAEGKEVAALIAEVVTERLAEPQTRGPSPAAVPQAEFIARLRKIAAMPPRLAWADGRQPRVDRRRAGRIRVLLDMNVRLQLSDATDPTPVETSPSGG
jgi:hypothetical protein